MDGRLSSLVIIATETLCLIVIGLNPGANGESAMLRRLHKSWTRMEAPISGSDGDRGKPAVLNKDVTSQTFQLRGPELEWLLENGLGTILFPNSRFKRDLAMTENPDTGQMNVTTEVSTQPTSYSTVDSKQTETVVDGVTSQAPESSTKTEQKSSTKIESMPSTVTKINEFSTTLKLAEESTTTKATTVSMTTTPTIQSTTTFKQSETSAPTAIPNSVKGTSSSTCVPERERLQVYFGDYGLIAFVVTLGVAVLLAYVLFMVLCLPRCKKRMKARKLLKDKDRIENLSSMRSPGAIYRPRPSLKKSTPCVPTPLAMISADDVTSITSRKDSRIIMTTDLDATSDPDFDGNGTTAIQYQFETDRKYSIADRKFSTEPTADTANVSTFLLRQASLREVEEKRKQSISDSTG